MDICRLIQKEKKNRKYPHDIQALDVVEWNIEKNRGLNNFDSKIFGSREGKVRFTHREEKFSFN